VGGHVAALALADAGALPGVAAGAAVALGLSHRRFAVEAGVAVTGPRSEALASVDGAQAEVLLAAGQLRGCAFPLASRLSLGPCAAVEVGVLRGRSRGVTNPGSNRTPWAAVQLGLLARLRLARIVSLRLQAAVGIPLTRPSFEIAGIGPVFEPSGATARGAAGLEVHFP
jgi:hypothetical protein